MTRTALIVATRDLEDIDRRFTMSSESFLIVRATVAIWQLAPTPARGAYSKPIRERRVGSFHTGDLRVPYSTGPVPYLDKSTMAVPMVPSFFGASFSPKRDECWRALMSDS